MVFFGKCSHSRTPARGTAGLAAAASILLAASLLGRSCAAEVPPEQGYDVYVHTNPDYLDLSPFWGMVAIQSRVLPNIRFFGSYTSHPNKDFPPFPAAKPYDCPQDAISAVVQRLFPSLDEINFVHNARELDPIGEIDRERKTGQGPGLKKIMALLEATRFYRNVLRASSAVSSSSAAAHAPHGFTGKDYREAVYRILNWEDAARDQYKARQVRAFDELRQEFADLAERAVLEESNDAWGQYPPDIVEIALLAYAWRAADSAEELFQAFGDSGLAPGLLQRPAAGTPRIVFDEAYYRANLADFLDRSPMMSHWSLIPPKSSRPRSPGEIVAFVQSFRRYTALVPDLLPQGQATYGKWSYPDCGETSLRNFFRIVLRHGEIIDLGILSAICAKFPTETKEAESKGERPSPRAATRLAKLNRYFAKYAALSVQWSNPARDDWSDLVVGLNDAGDPIPITYVDHRGFNVQGTGVVNMLNLIGHLLPDPVLNTRWPEGHLEKLEEISRRLDHLCEMFSRDGFTLDWNAGAGKKITSEFATIEFSINHIWEFIWQFQPRHFYLASTRRPGESWVRSLVCIPGNYYEEGFCAASGVLIDKSADGPFKPNTLFSSDLRSPDVARGAVQDLIKSGNPILRPMTMMLFHRSIPLDYFNLFCIAETIFKNPAFTHDKQFYPIQPWVEKPQYIKNDLLCQAMEHQVIDMACLMIDHGADVNLKTPRGLYLIQMAVGAGPVWSRYLDLEYRVLSRLIAHHVDLEVKDGVDPLFIAVNGPVKGVELLLKAGANPLARDSHGNTPRSCYNPKEYMADPRTPEILWLAEEAARRAATPAAGAGAGAGAGAVQPHATP